MDMVQLEKPRRGKLVRPISSGRIGRKIVKFGENILPGLPACIQSRSYGPIQFELIDEDCAQRIIESPSRSDEH